MTDPKANLKQKGMFHAYSKMFDIPLEDINAEFSRSLAEHEGAVKNMGIDLKPVVQSLVKVETRMESVGRLITSAIVDEKEVVLTAITNALGIINSYPFVKQLVVDGNNLVIYYEDVAITYNRKLWKLGPYKVLINLQAGGNQYVFTIYNLTVPTSQSSHHPHVVSQGRSICWGNIREGVYKLFSEMNFPVLVSLIWNFLNTYNEFDKYIALDRLFQEWGRVPESIPPVVKDGPK
jgi:hypothetical protein